MLSDLITNWLNSYGEDAFSSTVNTGLTATGGSSYYTALATEIAGCRTKYTAYDLAKLIAADGSKEDIASRNALREDLTPDMRALLANISAIAKGDPVMLAATKFPLRSTNRTPLGPRPAPETPVLSQGANSGTLKAATKTVQGASLYTGRIALASKPDVFVQTIQQTGVRFEFVGLTPGEVYMVQMNCIGAAGPSDWSDFGTLRVI